MSNEVNKAKIDFLAAGLPRELRSILLYAECCAVDNGGMLEGKRMNGEDYKNLDALEGAGYLTWGRIPSGLIGSNHLECTHFVALSHKGWDLAHKCRRLRANQHGPFSSAVWQEVTRKKEEDLNTEKWPAEVLSDFALEFVSVDQLDVERPIGLKAAELSQLDFNTLAVTSVHNSQSARFLSDSCRDPASAEVYQEVRKEKITISDDTHGGFGDYDVTLTVYDTCFGRVILTEDGGLFCTANAAKALLRYEWRRFAPVY